MPNSPQRVDLLVVGAGIVGLGVAYDGLLRGLKVAVVERDARAVGASVRNFGHGCVTAQTGLASAYGAVARERWLQLRDAAGLWAQECGTVVVARSEEELAVAEEFISADPSRGEILDAAGVLAQVDVAGAVGGAFLPNDIRVDPRRAVGALADYLASRGVAFHFSTNLVGYEPGRAYTSHGTIDADAIVLATGHDLDRLLPDHATDAGVLRCTLHMLRVENPTARPIAPAVLTGTSLLRYSGFLTCPSSAALQAQMERDHPTLLAAGVNLMLTQHPSGDLLIGDTHSYDETPSPFAAEELDALLLEEVRRLFGVDRLAVRERWQGTYAWAPDREYLTTTPAPGVRAVAVTSGIGMTTALGFAPSLLDDLLSLSRPS